MLCEEAPKAGDHKVELSKRFVGTAAGGVREYVVAPPLRAEIDKALSLVKSAVTKKRSYAAYLHGSFGAGKGHFLTVLHAVLNSGPETREKERLGRLEPPRPGRGPRRPPPLPHGGGRLGPGRPRFRTAVCGLREILPWVHRTAQRLRR